MCRKIIVMSQFGTPLASGFIFGPPNFNDEQNNECLPCEGCIVFVVV